MPAISYPAPLLYPDGRRVTCDAGCDFVFTKWSQVHEMESSVLVPYPDTLRLCPGHAEDLWESQREDHQAGQEEAREKGWNTYGSGWSVPERGEGYD